ncbi:MAG: hypothetical protein K2W95_26725 [Candidatus Obscuribacterales bacterium]|nr:hypothetical protein [Candidatus Obscuribacterales bacterium]
MRKILALMGVAMISLSLSGCKTAEEERAELAPLVCDFLDSRFQKLDTDKNGLIDEAELAGALAEAEARKNSGDRTAASDVMLLRHITDNIARIAHVTGSHVEKYTDVTYIVVSTDPFIMMPIYTDAERTVLHYGISAEDIKSYRIGARR